MGEVLSLLRAAAAAGRPFTLQLGPPRTFLPDTPVLYLHVGGEVQAVHALRDRAFGEPLARPLTWPFVPHVTLADEAEPSRIEAALVALGDYRVEAAFDRLHLLREEPGRRWEPIADATFEPPAVVGRGGLPLDLTVTDRLDPEAAAFWKEESAAVSRERFGEGWEPRHPFAVTARRDGRVVAVATGHTWGGGGHLEELLVAAGSRGQGIGSQVLARVEWLAAERGARAMTVHTWAEGPAYRFYRGRGWTRDGDLPPRPGADALIQMRRDL